jgi:hypothetical protein
MITYVRTLRSAALGALLLVALTAKASSHREAPLIANDPLADNTDVYAFRSPDNPNTITIIANYIPAELPHGGPNYNTFGENIRYEIHIDNDATRSGDEIVYRFTFRRVNEDPTTFFNIRLGAQNLKTTYTLERSIDGGFSFQTIVSNGSVPPPNIGPRSIEGGAGLNTTYEQLISNSILTSTTGERVYCGPADDPFYVDLGGVFDLGNLPRQGGASPRDGLGRYNVHSIAIQVPISTLLKSGAPETPDKHPRPGLRHRRLGFRQPPRHAHAWNERRSEFRIRRLGTGFPFGHAADQRSRDSDWLQRLLERPDALPRTERHVFDEFFYNPELGLYMDDDLFGGAVPAFAPLAHPAQFAARIRLRQRTGWTLCPERHRCRGRNGARRCYFWYAAAAWAGETALG